ncbi:MAG: thioesterase [Desulfuromonadaceae bacterium]|nr:thioesterase [Desulfuromonadaceae bacterium]
MQAIFEKSFSVSYHELDSQGNLRLLTILNHLQDIAGVHAAQLGVSVNDLRPQGLTWVLSRIHLLFERYPRAEETVLLRTWPATRQGLSTCREFELRDIQGSCLVRASTSWVLLNTSTRRPVRLENHLPPYPLTPCRAIDDDFAALPPLTDGAIAEMGFRVLRGDLDINLHVNNTVFAGWAVEAVPDEIAAGTLTELEIAFRAEALYGESIISRCAALEEGQMSCCLHQIVNSRDGKELARLRTHWKS